MTLRNNRAPLLCCFKLCTSFRSHDEFKLELQYDGNAQFGSKLTIVLAVLPWNLTDDLEKQQGSFPQRHKALCIISSSYVNSSYGPETAKLGFDLGYLDLWPLTLTVTFYMDITSVIGNNYWKFHDGTMRETLWKKVKQTDGWTDGRTERNVLRAAWS